MKNILNKIIEEADRHAVDGLDFLTRINNERQTITLTYFKGKLVNSFEFNVIKLMRLRFDYTEVITVRCRELAASIINHKKD